MTVCYKYVTLGCMKQLHFDAYTSEDGTSQFREFLESLPPKDRAKLLATIEKAEEYGLIEATR